MGWGSNTRNATKDFSAATAAGETSGSSFIHKFGHTHAVGTSNEDIWLTGGSYNWLTSSAGIRVKAGGNAADAAGGAGAKTVTIVGLNQLWGEAEETVTLSGTAASPSTTGSFVRVFRAYVSTVGAYGATNVGNVVLETTSSITIASIDAGQGQSQVGLYTVPTGKTAYLNYVELSVDSSKRADIVLTSRKDADITTGGNMASWRIKAQWDGMKNSSQTSYPYPMKFSEKTDITFNAKVDSGTAAVSVHFGLNLLTNT